MGKKSRKGKARGTQHQHGKSKRAAQVEKMRSRPPAQAAKPAAPVAPPVAPPVAAAVAPVAPPVAAAAPPPPAATTTTKKNDNTNGDFARDIVQTMSDDSQSIPSPLVGNLHLFSPSQAKLANNLCKAPTNQPHVFEGWTVESKEDDKKKMELIQQLERMDRAYPSGGLVGYVKNAKELLEKSKRGENPLEGWVPSVPNGEMFEIGTESYDEFEGVGLKEVGKCGFVLVAGGLGERLGYGGIKVS